MTPSSRLTEAHSLAADGESVLSRDACVSGCASCEVPSRHAVDVRSDPLTGLRRFVNELTSALLWRLSPLGSWPCSGQRTLEGLWLHGAVGGSGVEASPSCDDGATAGHGLDEVFAQRLHRDVEQACGVDEPGTVVQVGLDLVGGDAVVDHQGEGEDPGGRRTRRPRRGPGPGVGCAPVRRRGLRPCRRGRGRVRAAGRAARGRRAVGGMRGR